MISASLDRSASNFIQSQWAIAPELWIDNLRSLIDDPDSGQTELTTALDRQVSRLWRPKRVEAIGFFSEDGSFFQARYLKGYDADQRYIARVNSGNLIYKPSIPAEYRKLINDQHGLNVLATGSFWEWVQKHPECPVAITEGPAKALALVGIGYPSVAGFGAFGGIQRSELKRFKRSVGKRKSGKEGGWITEKVSIPARLPAGLAELARSGRKFVLCPDLDTSPKTRRMVAIAYLHTARLLKKAGCEVRIAYWDSRLGKGIDDVLRTHGAEKVQRTLDQALTPVEFELKTELSFQLAAPNATIDSRSMNHDAPAFPKTGLIFTDAAPGTGKTKLIGRETVGNTLLAPFPLRSLAKAAAETLNANFRNAGKRDRDRGTYSQNGELSDRLTVCYDSLPKIDLLNQFAGESLDDLILDEITHGFRHSFVGSTCKKERLAILEKLVEAIKSAKRIIASDADLTRVELDILRQLRPGDPEFYLKNTRLPDPWDISWLPSGNKSQAIAYFTSQLEKYSDGLVHWATDSITTTNEIQQYIETFGRRCAVVNRETIEAKDNPYAQLAISGNFEALRSLGVTDIVCSPSVVQGLSWEGQGDFAAVIGIFSGSTITPRQMRQSLSRVRESVPRLIWCSEYRRVPGHWGNESNPNILKQRMLEALGFAARSLDESVEETDLRQLAVDVASKLLAEDNRWMASPRAGLKMLLEEYQHNLTPVELAAVDTTDFDASCDEWQRQQNRAILDAPILSESDYKYLSLRAESEGCKREERLSLRRYELCHFYGLDPTALTLGDIELDDNGRFRSQVRQFEALYSPDGKELAESRSRQSLPGSAVDLKRDIAALQVRKRLGLDSLIQQLRSASMMATDPAIATFYEQCQQWRAGIKTALNYTVCPTAKPFKILGELLNQLGLKTVSTRARADGACKRAYSLDVDQFALLNRIAESRYLKGIERENKGDPHPTNIYFQTPVDQHKNTPQTQTEQSLEQNQSVPQFPEEGQAVAEKAIATPAPADLKEVLDASEEFLEADGFKVGDRVVIADDHLGKDERREWRKGKPPVGQSGIITRLFLNKAALLHSMKIYRASLRLDGDGAYSADVSFLRRA